MSSTESLSSTAILEAHRALRFDLQRLLEAARSTPHDHPDALAAQLEATRTDLQDHFRFEEENGYMASILKMRPHLSREIQQMQAEHGTLLRSLNELISEARSAAILSYGLREKVHDWVSSVQRHEHSENVLVQDAYNLDVAAED